MINDLFQYAMTKRMPLHTNFQITYRCNFKCKHCYQTPIRQHKFNEMSSDDIKKILNILKDKKCFYLTLIGGEVFIRDDFNEIYKYAYDKNFKIDIGTNAYLINESNIKILSANKPAVINITLYGSTNKTYEAFTGVKNGFDKVSNNIYSLVKNGINVNLKTVLNIINKDEINEMDKFAKSLNLPFNRYYKIKCYNDGNNISKSLQIPSKDLINYLDLNAEKEKYIKYAKVANNVWENNIHKCAAGINEAYIDPEGSLFLCNSSDNHKWSINKYGFDYCWEKILEERKKEIEVVTPCGVCNFKNRCGLCAPVIKKEYGELCKPYKECEEGFNLAQSFNNKI